MNSGDWSLLRYEPATPASPADARRDLRTIDTGELRDDDGHPRDAFELTPCDAEPQRA